MKVRKKAPRSSLGAFTNVNIQREISVEKHYSVAELAEMWSLSENTIRRIFENEPGVLKWSSKETRFTRRYTTLRIPETVVLRVHRQLQAAG